MPSRLMNDYGATRPLWNDEGALRAWTANFNAYFSWEQGWPSAAMKRDHRAEGERLLAALREALQDDDVTFDYWETKHR